MAPADTFPAIEAAPAETRRARYSAIRYPLLLLLIIIGFYWKLTLTQQYDWVWGPDLAQQVLPWFEEEARQLQHHHFPLWDPHNFAGQPLLAQAQPGAAYPLNWILFLMPRIHGHMVMTVLAWYYIAIHYMAGLFCYLLCRDLGRSRAAALIGGLVFSLAGYVGTIDWPQMVNGAVWAPLILMFLLRAVHGRRPIVSAALAGLFLGLSWLSGHHQVPIYLTLTSDAVWLYYILRTGRPDWNVVKLAALMVVFMLFVGALQVLPAEEYGHLSKRWAGARHETAWNEPVPYYVHRQFSLYPISLLAIVFPAMNRNADPFIGVVALTLALAAIAFGWRHHLVKLFGAVMLGGLIYSLGHNSVFHGFIYAIVPLVDKARVPGMATVIFSIGAAVLVSFGVDYFAERGRSIWARRIGRAVLVFGLLTYTLIVGSMFVNKMSWSADDRVAMTAFVALLLAGLLYLWRRGKVSARPAFAMLAMLLLLELGNDAGYAFIDRDDTQNQSFLEKVRSNNDIAQYLSGQPGVFRVESTTDKIALSWAEYHNFDVVLGLLAGVTENMMRLEWHTWQTKMLFGVRYSFGDKPPLDDSQEVFTAASGVKIYRNPAAWPRVWAVHEIIPIAKDSDGRDIINNRVFELHQKAFMLTKAPPLTTCPDPDTVDISKYEPQRVAIRAAMGCQGMVVLSDTYFPGWNATVDGKPSQINEVNAAMRGVVVPKGAHELVFRYQPRSVYIGAIMTFVGIAGAIALALAL